MKRVAMLLVVVGLVACTAKGILDGLDSFPCAADGTCPAGFACQADAGCRSTGSDSPTKNTDQLCVSGDNCNEGSYCNYGVCTAPRDNRALCPSDHPVSTQGGCLGSCENGTPCPATLACMPVVASEKSRGQYMAQGCVAPWQASLLDAPCASDEVCNKSGKNGETGFSGLVNITCVDSTCVSPCIGADGGSGCPTGHVCKSSGSKSGCFAPP